MQNDVKHIMELKRFSDSLITLLQVEIWITSFAKVEVGYYS